MSNWSNRLRIYWWYFGIKFSLRLLRDRNNRRNEHGTTVSGVDYGFHIVIVLVFFEINIWVQYFIKEKRQ